MDLTRIYDEHYGGALVENLHVSALLCDMMIWAKSEGYCVRDIVDDAANHCATLLPTSWLNETDWVWTNAPKRGYVEAGSDAERVRVFSRVLRNLDCRAIADRWRAVLLVSAVIDSLEDSNQFVECAESADVLLELHHAGKLLYA